MPRPAATRTLGAALLLLALAGCGGQPTGGGPPTSSAATSDPSSVTPSAPSTDATPSAAASASGAATPLAPGTTIHVYGFAQSEPALVGDLYVLALQAKGLSAQFHRSDNFALVQTAPLQMGGAVVSVDFAYSRLRQNASGVRATSADEVTAKLHELLATGQADVLPPAAVGHHLVYAVTKSYAAKTGVHTLADLTGVAASATAITAPGAATAPNGLGDLTAAYGVTFKFNSYTALPADRVRQLNAGTAQVGVFYDTENATGDLVVLDDPKQMIVPDQLIPVATRNVVGDSTAAGAIEAVDQALTRSDLDQLEKAIFTDHQTETAVLGDWLKGKGLA